MDFKSKYFDKIRINKGGKKRAAPVSNTCQWDGCDKPGTHRAPMGRDFEGQYLNFCFDHVREYNKTYNYFSGLDDESIARYHKESLTGHRPTWTMGVNRAGDIPPLNQGDPKAATSARVRARLGPGGARGYAPQRERKLRTLEKKSLEDLGLPPNAKAEEIKTRYKELVKRHHPDANGGDRSSEDRLRQIIQAYKYLRQAGFC
jgi:DnaJ domain